VVWGRAGEKGEKKQPNQRIRESAGPRRKEKRVVAILDEGNTLTQKRKVGHSRMGGKLRKFSRGLGKIKSGVSSENREKGKITSEGFRSPRQGNGPDYSARGSSEVG